MGAALPGFLLSSYKLLLNGKSIGRQRTAPLSELEWKVKYAPGTLAARAYRGGHVVAETEVATTGQVAALSLTPDRSQLRADGEDVAVVTVAAVDAQGRVVPTADVSVALTFEGPGRIIGVGNGNPASHEADVFVGARSARVRALEQWRWKRIDDVWAEKNPDLAPGADDSKWATLDVRRATGPLGPDERGIFRTTFNVTAAELASDAVELWFAKIDGGGQMFVNGKRLGPTGDSRAPSIYDLKSLLHPGANTVAVTLRAYGPAAGINKGVELRLYDHPRQPAWSRSTFNGLAQVIVKTGKQPGALELAARAAGIAPATARVTVSAATPRPMVE